MKRIGLGILQTVALALALTAIGQTSKNKVSWQSKMTDLSNGLSDIIPDLFSMDNSPPQIAKLKKKTDKLYSIVSNIDPSLGHAVKAPDMDPALPYIAQQLRENIQRANQSLKEGHNEYAKTLLRSSVSYCIACHTRSQTGPQFQLLSAFTEPLKKASWLDRITFQAASRQFDPVYQSVMDQLKVPLKSDVSPLDLEQAARIALAISIRVKQNPKQAIALSESIISSSQASAGLKEDAFVWLQDLHHWQKEPIQNFKSDKDLIERARALVSVSEGEDTPIWTAHSEVKYLRASLLMHDFFREFPDSPMVGEALYLNGVSYDQLRDLGLWSLHEIYYQACIHKSPHTKIAGRCFDRYKDSVTFGFTGSKGTSIPLDVSEQLKALKKMAAEAPKK